MKKRKKNDSKLNIGKFIIINFFIVMLGIYILNILGDYIIQNYYWNLLDRNFHIKEANVFGKGLWNNLKLLLYILISFNPSRFSAIQRFIFGPIIEAMDIQISAPPYIINRGGIGIIIYYTLLIFILLTMVMVSFLPYLVGGLYFVFVLRYKLNELREYDRQKTLEYERQRNLLLSDITHDIKTPITALSGYAKALSDGLVAEEQKQEYLNSIYTKAMRVSDLINMMFEYIKLDSAEYTLNKSRIDLGEIARESVVMLFQDFEEAGIELVIDIPEEKLILNADGLQISRVISNLLGNALKYCESGNTVRISITSKDLSAREKRYTICVEDTGEQISDELANSIFNPFTRGDKTRSTKGGTGLGLSIAHKIILLHDGELILDRNRDDGYTKGFVITLNNI